MYTVVVTPVRGDQVIRQYQFFSDAYASLDQLTVAFFADSNLKSVEMRFLNEKI